MLDSKTMETIKSTVPALKDHGVEITKLFYKNMFNNNPEVKPLFNMKDQENGAQPLRLAESILAVAQNIDSLEKVMPAIEKIAKRHVEVSIKPEHYPIVGKNLILTLQEFLNIDQNHDIIVAWTKAYQVLSKAFIQVESKIYEAQNA